jgi:hypothetical protein
MNLPVLGGGDVLLYVPFFCTPAACCSKLNGGDALSRVYGNLWLTRILMWTRSSASLGRRFIQ